MKVGDKVLLARDLDDPTSIVEKTVTKVGSDTVQCGSAEETYFKAFLWPVKYRDELVAVVTERQRLKKAHTDSMKLVFELKNKISREGGVA